MNKGTTKYCDKCLEKGKRTVIGAFEEMDFYAWCSQKYCKDCAKEVVKERDRIRKRQWRKDTRKERAELKKQVSILRNQTEKMLEALEMQERENRLLRNRLLNMGVRLE